MEAGAHYLEGLRACVPPTRRRDDLAGFFFLVRVALGQVEFHDPLGLADLSAVQADEDSVYKGEATIFRGFDGEVSGTSAAADGVLGQMEFLVSEQRHERALPPSLTVSGPYPRPSRDRRP